MGDILNDKTPKELVDLQNEALKRIKARKGKRPPEMRVCAWCEGEYLMRIGQKFCSDSCRVQYHNASIEALWEAERAAFLAEIEELRTEVARLRALVGD